MKNRIAAIGLAVLILGGAALAESPAPQPPADLAGSMAQRLGRELNVKTVTGEPLKVGSVTLIPIFMIDVHFGGGAKEAPPAPAAGLFYMSGEARPLGFVAITKKGTRFLSAVPAAK